MGLTPGVFVRAVSQEAVAARRRHLLHLLYGGDPEPLTPVATAAALTRFLEKLAGHDKGIACEIFAIVVAQMSCGMDAKDYAETNPFTIGFTTVLVRKGPYQQIRIKVMLRHLHAGTFPLRGIGWTSQNEVRRDELVDTLFEKRFMRHPVRHLRLTFFDQSPDERREEQRLEQAHRAHLLKQWGYVRLAQATEIADVEAAAIVVRRAEEMLSRVLIDGHVGY